MEKPADKEELLLVLNEDGSSTGRLELRSKVHNENLLHNEVALWILDVQGGRVLLQRRNKNKKCNPNKLGLCAGHVVADTSIMQTLKDEFFEEYGLNLDDYDVHKLMTIKRTAEFNHHFSHQFYIEANIPLEKIKLQEEEVSEVLYMDYEKLKELYFAGSDEIVFKSKVYEEIFKKLDKVFSK